MRPIEPKPRLGAGEDPSPYDAENKRGPGVIAEAQKPLGFVPAALTGFVQGDGGSRTNRIAPDDAQEKRSGAASAHPKQRCHQWLHQGSQRPNKSRIHAQR